MEHRCYDAERMMGCLRFAEMRDSPVVMISFGDAGRMAWRLEDWRPAALKRTSVRVDFHDHSTKKVWLSQ